MLSCLLACAASLVWQFAPDAAPSDRVLAGVAIHAAHFWEHAPLYAGRETWRTETPGAYSEAAARPRLFHRRASLPSNSVSSVPVHQVVSYYAFSSFRKSPEALREFRQIVSIDGKPVKGNTSLAAFEARLARSDDRWKHKFLNQFEDAAEGGAVTDFGQILLLFTRASQRHYSFRMARHARIGDQPAIVLVYEQLSGSQSVHFISGPNTEDRQPLRGELWVRESDNMPVRVTMSAIHNEDGKEIRDQADVEYAPLPDGALLPASITHQRFAGDTLIEQNALRYSDWQLIPSTRGSGRGR